MAVSLAVGSAQLLQLGVSISDVALVLSTGRKIGNWFRVSSNDDELLASIGEDQEAILKRRGLITTDSMERRWSEIDFYYQGQHHNNSSQVHTRQTTTGLSAFSWLMITIVAALDPCLPSSTTRAIIRRIFIRVLDRQELEGSLRITLPANIESWRQAGCVRKINLVVSLAMRDCRRKLLEEYAFPQLNTAEMEEMEDFLVWLLNGSSSSFSAISVMVFAAAVGIGKAGVKLRTEGKRTYETEPFVHYVETHGPFLPTDTKILNPGVLGRGQQVAYPRNEPSSMIHSVPAGRPTVTNMIRLWDLGSKAASKMHLQAEADLPYSASSEVYYVLENSDIETSSFGRDVVMLAGHCFPERSEKILLAIEELAQGVSGNRLEWLHQRTELGFLQRARGSDIAIEAHRTLDDNMGLWHQYQALVFGFYYGLMGQLVSLELIHEETYFKGLWGYGSTTFLTMCAEFGDIIRRQGKISRTHVMYMLSTMYSGRPKSFQTLATGKGLLGILGSISVLSTPLLRITDNPQEISGFMLVDLPILDLTSDADGELFASSGGGIRCDMLFPDLVTTPCAEARSPTKLWSVHAKMGVLFGDGLPGVVMAARCGGRLVGWFNPMAANVAFLSTCYQQRRHDAETNYIDDFKFSGFEIGDSHWQNGLLPMTSQLNPSNVVGIVQSKDCPVLRYAAAGMYMEAGEEVVIATDDIEAAYGRVEGQGNGIIIA